MPDVYFQEKFAAEVHRISQLRHPNIVAVYGYETDPIAIVMEYYSRGSLRQYLQENGPLDLPVALDIACQIAGARHDTHDQRIVHNDLKPNNVLLKESPEFPTGWHTALADFGLAQLIVPDVIDTSGLPTDPFEGSYPYMAPERFRNSNATEESADIYALGIVLHEILLGTPPFVPSGFDMHAENTLIRRMMFQHRRVFPLV